MTDEPKIIIPIESYQKLCTYIDIADGEITGFTEVEVDLEKNTFTIGEVYLIKQEATGSDVEMDANDIAEFNDEYMKKNPDAEMLPRVWWHSHDTMSAFFSSTDDSTIKNFKNETFLLALVGNKKHEFKAKLRVFSPIHERFDIEVEDLDITIDYGEYKNKGKLEKEVAKKVNAKKKEEKFNYSTNYSFPENRTDKRKKIIRPVSIKEDILNDTRIYIKLKEADTSRPLDIPFSSSYEYQKPYPLSKDLDTALARIVKHDLYVVWDVFRKEFLFTNLSSDLYIDTWNVFDGYNFVDIVEQILEAKIVATKEEDEILRQIQAEEQEDFNRKGN